MVISKKTGKTHDIAMEYGFHDFFFFCEKTFFIILTGKKYGAGCKGGFFDKYDFFVIRVFRFFDDHSR